MLAIVVVSLVTWWFTRDRLPDKVVLLTGGKQGQYYKLGMDVAASAQRSLDAETRFEVQATHGSIENFELIKQPHMQLAIVQGGTVPIEQLATIAPLYLEIIHVIVRKDSDIQTIDDLEGRSIALGSAGSGARASALRVLQHFNVDVEGIKHNERYFKELIDEDSPLEGAIVTAGIQHQDLNKVLKTKRFRLLPIETSPAMEMIDPYLRSFEIPTGLYDQEPALPPTNVKTVVTPAYLVAKPETPARIVDATLVALYEDNLRIEFPNLIPRHDAPNWVPTRLHPAARQYFHPADNLGLFQSIMESLLAVKEILVALAFGVYLCWQRWQNLLQREEQEQFSKQKEYLDTLLEKTLKIESALVDCSDSSELGRYLKEVTSVKIEALREFTDEELRGDNTFSIFLQQCDSLLHAIQLKMKE